MEYYFIDIAAAICLTVPHSIGPIFMQLSECMISYLRNYLTNVGLQMFICLCFVSITLSINGAPQQIVQRYQIAASWRPIDFTISPT